jgi:hypothetical protein
MYKYVFLILLILTNRYQTEAQVSNNASGNDLSNQFGSISYSVGEVFYIQKGSQYFLTEGVQNSITKNPSISKSTIKLSIYPNPTSDFIHFNFQNSYYSGLSYKIYNHIGNELLQGRIQSSNAQISLTQLPASIYLLKVYMEKEEMASIKIIKIN